MAGETLQVGPFVGGINTQSDPSSIADSELVDCVNLELDLDGSLIVRPPIQTVTDTNIGSPVRILGVAVFSGGHYFIATDGVSTYWRLGSGDWNEIGSNLHTGAIAQYAGKVWLIPAPGETTDGGSWDPSGGFTADADIPNGEAAAIYKERLFVVPGFGATSDESRLRFSNAGDFGAWGTNDFIDIAKGDGQKLVDIAVFRTNLILFKDQSTYIMSYDGSPADSIIENLNPTIGPSAPRCVATYENSIFVNQEGKIYELLNFDYQQINIKVPFVLDETVPVGTARYHNSSLSVVGDRLIVRHFNRIYVYGLRTKTWTRWESADEELHNFGYFVGHGHHAENEYLAGSCITQHSNVFSIKDVHEDGRDECNDSTPVTIQCSIRTKNYNIAASHVFKRLNWWGVDILTTSLVTGIVNPITALPRVSWKFLKDNGYKWSDLKGMPWSAPTGGLTFVEDPDITTNTSITRKFVKFIGALRYRLVNFQVKFDSTGDKRDGPDKLYWLVIKTSTRQLVDKKVA